VSNVVQTHPQLNPGDPVPGFLADLPDEQAERVLAESLKVDVPAGAVVYREGDPARCFLVLNGLLRSYMSSRDGRQVTFRYGKSGDVMGLASVIGEPLPLTIQAMTASSVVALRADTLRHLLATDPIVARACAEELTRQLNQALEDVAQSAFRSVRQRLARELLDLATETDGPHLAARVSHQELADSIATSREVVTRNLHEMRADGLVETEHDRLVILLDVTGLAREVESARPKG
jgi:CRP/FNR family transcriptional regulator, cyclic AMP receptor protein